jgi:hypothetical protein
MIVLVRVATSVFRILLAWKKVVPQEKHFTSIAQVQDHFFFSRVKTPV